MRGGYHVGRDGDLWQSTGAGHAGGQGGTLEHYSAQWLCETLGQRYTPGTGVGHRLLRDEASSGTPPVPKERIETVRVGQLAGSRRHTIRGSMRES